MKMWHDDSPKPRAFLRTLLIAVAISGCTRSPEIVDRPQLSPQVHLLDATVHSAILSHDLPLRIIVPSSPPKGDMLPVVYLLHGAGQNNHDWSNHSAIATFAAQNVVLVMPEAENSFYMNEASGTDRRYEDYLVQEVLPEVHRLVPYAASDRAHNAIVGISRGGFGAVDIALRHPQLFSFVGDFSGALDLAQRPLRLRAPLDSFAFRRAFGVEGSATRRETDPFMLLEHVSPQDAPYFFIACGNKDSLLRVNQRFAATLAQHGYGFEAHELDGGHDWKTWNAALPAMEAALIAHFKQSASPAP